MNLEKLKPIRIVVSLAFFLPITLLFIDIGSNMSVGITTLLVSFQFIPSLAKLMAGVGTAAVGFGAVLLLTLLFGRVYCSTICPLGTLQDFVIALQRKINRRRHFKYQPTHTFIHYSLTAIAILSFAAGNLLLLNLFEPFSNFGRMLTALIRPVVMIANNLTAGVLNASQIFWLVQMPMRQMEPALILIPAVFLGMIVFLSYRHGRLFCNSFCPAGALLGLLSRISLFRIVIDVSTCKDCGLCEKVCKAQCIDSKNHHIDFSACVSCFNCIDACPTVGLRYQGIRERPPVMKTIRFDETRRKFFRTAVAPIAAGVIAPAVMLADEQPVISRYFEARKLPVSPPGSIGTDRFSSLCTACHLCIDICPTQVLYPSLLEYGVGGIFQPRMNYSASFCNYDCVLCSEVCPSGAILPVTPPQKKEIQLGRAVFVKDDCIVITKKKDCGACSEHCPTKAVKMVPYEKRFLPEVNNEICVGCGACEHSCPTQPRRAIYIQPHAVHRHAKKPEVKKLEPAFDSSQEFPF